MLLHLSTWAEIEGFLAGLLRELGVYGDIAAEENLNGGAEVADDTA